ncbi:hypothetical protein V6O07_02145, partial [Arthrospira platensis SPKY2]
SDTLSNVEYRRIHQEIYGTSLDGNDISYTEFPDGTGYTIYNRSNDTVTNVSIDRIRNVATIGDAQGTTDIPLNTNLLRSTRGQNIVSSTDPNLNLIIDDLRTTYNIPNTRDVNYTYREGSPELLEITWPGNKIEVMYDRQANTFSVTNDNGQTWVDRNLSSLSQNVGRQDIQNRLTEQLRARFNIPNNPNVTYDFKVSGTQHRLTVSWESGGISYEVRGSYDTQTNIFTSQDITGTVYREPNLPNIGRGQDQIETLKSWLSTAYGVHPNATYTLYQNGRGVQIEWGNYKIQALIDESSQNVKITYLFNGQLHRPIQYKSFREIGLFPSSINLEPLIPPRQVQPVNPNLGSVPVSHLIPVQKQALGANAQAISQHLERNYGIPQNGAVYYLKNGRNIDDGFVVKWTDSNGRLNELDINFTSSSVSERYYREGQQILISDENFSTYLSNIRVGPNMFQSTPFDNLTPQQKRVVETLRNTDSVPMNAEYYIDPLSNDLFIQYRNSNGLEKGIHINIGSDNISVVRRDYLDNQFEAAYTGRLENNTYLQDTSSNPSLPTPNPPSIPNPAGLTEAEYIRVYGQVLNLDSYTGFSTTELPNGAGFVISATSNTGQTNTFTVSIDRVNNTATVIQHNSSITSTHSLSPGTLDPISTPTPTPNPIPTPNPLLFPPNHSYQVLSITLDELNGHPLEAIQRDLINQLRTRSNNRVPNNATIFWERSSGNLSFVWGNQNSANRIDLNILDNSSGGYQITETIRLNNSSTPVNNTYTYTSSQTPTPTPTPTPPTPTPAPILEAIPTNHLSPLAKQSLGTEALPIINHLETHYSIPQDAVYYLKNNTNIDDGFVVKWTEGSINKELDINLTQTSIHETLYENATRRSRITTSRSAITPTPTPGPIPTPGPTPTPGPLPQLPLPDPNNLRTLITDPEYLRIAEQVLNTDEYLFSNLQMAR